MTEQKQNFILVPDQAPAPRPTPQPGTLIPMLRSLARSFITWLVPRAATWIEPAATDTTAPTRPRLVFAFDATASREPAWATARRVTDALFKALPGELDVALAVHGGSRLHTFTAFTTNANTLRDRAAGIVCEAGHTRLLAILSESLKRPGVRVITYVGDVFEESLSRGRRLADTMGQHGIRLIVLHDTADRDARRDAEIFLDLARRTGGCVIPFDATAPERLRELLAAVAVYTVGGITGLQERSGDLPGALVLLEHLGATRRH